MRLAGGSCVGLIVTGSAVVGLCIFFVAVCNGKQGAFTVDRFQGCGRQSFE